ncbi:SRPBCC domain-containing protein [Pedobacter punctiformis]|uniref:SRPBCC domain-containing protein n=1 Tax=Pedobacter punctiformis TaxID=3004097 RepID=A0ABT4L411_9SPHI|nr:SRPBCC domain-containing protein [Pedobacter sp. HCMS5-2]MCZ4242665.1 SRPBCC domain-containing protein [Pedobacter sp. HCMS5-2]
MANRSLRITKILNAPIDLVWKVWTDPVHIANWWGPIGFTNTIHKMDLIADGEWCLTMHGPDGKNYPNKSVFLEIIPSKKIVFQHFNPNYLATIVFESKESQTLMEWTMLFETNELFETVVKVFKADEGLNQNVEKLETYLKRMYEEQ